MPTSNATIEPRTTGTWYVGVCESSRHDWPNPAPDFVRVASMVLSPPRLRPRCHGIWVLGQFPNCSIIPIRMMWCGLSRKLLLSPGARRLFPPEWASLSKNGEPCRDTFRFLRRRTLCPGGGAPRPHFGHCRDGGGKAPVFRRRRCAL